MDVRDILEKNKNCVVIILVVSIIFFLIGMFSSGFSKHNDPCPSLESGYPSCPSCPVVTQCPTSTPCPSCPDINAESCWEDYFFNPTRKNFVKTETTEVVGFANNKKILLCPSNAYVTGIGFKKKSGSNYFYNIEIKCSDGSIQTDYFSEMPNFPEDSLNYQNSSNGFKDLDVSWTVEGENNTGQILGFRIKDLNTGDLSYTTNLSCANRIMGLEVYKLYDDAPWIGGLALVCGDFETS